MARIAGSSGHQTQKKIKTACLALFANSGYEAVSMRQIANEVGINPGAIYHYFPTKQHILMAIMEEHMRALLTAWDAQKDDNLHALDHLDRFVRFHISYHMNLPDHVYLSYRELRALSEENFLIIERLRHNYECLLKTILSDGQAKGCMAITDVHAAAMAILSMLTGINKWFRHEGRLSARQIEDIYADLCRRTVLLSGVNPEMALIGGAKIKAII